MGKIVDVLNGRLLMIEYSGRASIQTKQKENLILYPLQQIKLTLTDLSTYGRRFRALSVQRLIKFVHQLRVLYMDREVQLSRVSVCW